MNIKRKILLYYSTFLTLFISVSGLIISANNAQGLIFQLIFLPVTLYFVYSSILIFLKKNAINTIGIKLIIYYNFILTSIMALMGFLSVNSIPQFISAILFLPLSFYYLLLVIPKKRKALIIPQLKRSPKQSPVKLKSFDTDRRTFLKLIGSAGLSIFMLALFTKKAEAAFFGSVPGPGTVAIKDTTGAQINPAIKHPTDGYKITQLDETTDLPNTYYGFVNKDGAWFIMLDDGSGNYRYRRGDSDFTNDLTGWPDRTDLEEYGYFYAIFD